MKRFGWVIFFGALGILCLILPFHITMTGLCFLALAAVLLALQLLKGSRHERSWRVILISLTVLSMAAVLGAMTYIAIDGRDSLPDSDPPEFVVVLGAQIQGEQPSLTLKKRLDRAADYLSAHPAAVAFVSGGQGSDEQLTEAAVMERYLQSVGIAPERILREEQASNTRENLAFSRQLARQQGLRTDSVLIITSEYHLCRAKYIARSLGLTAYGLGSDTWPKILEVNYLLREVFAFVKAFFQAGV